MNEMRVQPEETEIDLLEVFASCGTERGFCS